MQRLHDDDLAGRLIASEQFKTLCLPAIATEREEIDIGRLDLFVRNPGDVLQPRHEPRESLEWIQKEIGSAKFAAQYQQAPVPASGNLISPEWFCYSEGPPRQAGDRIVQSWDTAMKDEEIHDYSVCTTWLQRGSRHYLLEVIRNAFAIQISRGWPWRRMTSIGPTPSSSKIRVQALPCSSRSGARSESPSAASLRATGGSTGQRVGHFRGRQHLPASERCVACRLRRRTAQVSAEPPRRSGRQHDPIPSLGPREEMGHLQAPTSVMTTRLTTRRLSSPVSLAQWLAAYGAAACLTQDLPSARLRITVPGQLGLPSARH